MTDDWTDTISAWNDQTKAVPSMVRDHIAKARMKPEEAARGLRTQMFDPLAIQYAMGFKDRKYSLTYDVLKRIPHQVSVISAILQTRCNQVAAFSVPYRSSKAVGFVIKHKDPSHLTTKSEQEFIKDLERFIYNCGNDKPNPHNNTKRDDFESFLKKIVRDSLQYDQACVEVIPDRRGAPYEFMAVDAATIRIAAVDTPFGPNEYWHGRSQNYSGRMLAEIDASPNRHPYRALKLYEGTKFDKKADFVQIINGQIENVYTRDEMIFGVRNPRTDIYIQGYGYGELEQLVTTVTAHLYAEEYNRRFFSQGSAPKGILNFKGDSMTPDQLEGFRRQWRANLEGVDNAWRTPILQSEQGVDWIDLNPTNKDMEYGSWLEYLIKITCGVFLIDPAEINFDLKGGVQQTPLFESSQEWKLKASRDRGLKPLLRFLAKMINENIISQIDDHFVFDFAGLEELTEQEKHTLRTEQVASYLTLNEVRRSDDLPDLEHGDIPMNPTYLQAMQQKMQEEQQKEQMDMQTAQMDAQTAAQEGAEGGAEGGGMGEEEDEVNAPQYSDSFGKSLVLPQSDGKYLEIDLNDLDDWKDSIR
jgi:hypothetical protein